MAKKEKKELTLEERLKEALVPEEEWPYRVPENWCWVRMASIYSINPKNIADDHFEAAFVPMEKISAGDRSDFEFEVQPWGKAKKGHTQFANGDVAFAKISPCFENGKSMIVDGLPNGIGGGTTELIVLRQPLISKEYTYWLVSTDRFIKGGCKTYTGTVGQQRISMEYVKKYPVPLPPLPEQHRIVARIESLFAKLDEAKALAQAVVDGFEDRKAAILHKAFTGELTKEWRKQPGNDSFRKTVTVKSVCTSLKYGTASKSSKSGRIAVIRMGNLQGGEINWTNLVYSDNEDDNEKYRLVAGDVLFNRTNSAEHVGKTSIYRGEFPAIYAGYLIKLDYDHEIVFGDYLNYILNSPEAREYCNRVKSDAVNQSNINAQKIGAFEFPLVGMNEQTKIIGIIQSMFKSEQHARESAETVLDQIVYSDEIGQALYFRPDNGRMISGQMNIPF